jgi:hypothetical protein
MSMASFNALMNHTVILTKVTRNGYGDFSDISSTTIKGHVQYGETFVTNKKGEKLLAKAIVFLKDDCGIDISHPYWKINQTAPQIRNDMEVINIDPIDDPRNGLTHHFELAVR